MEDIVKIVKELPPELQKEVEDFVIFLKEKKRGDMVKSCSKIGLVR